MGALFTYYVFMREAEIHYDQCSWAKRLLSMMEDFISTESLGHFARTVRDGGTVFIGFQCKCLIMVYVYIRFCITVTVVYDCLFIYIFINID